MDSDNGKEVREDCTRQPMGETPEALAPSAHRIGEDLADVDPNHRTLRHGEEGDEAHQRPE